MIGAEPGLTECQFYEPLPAERVRCQLCPHRCDISPGQAGLCSVRVNRDGRLFLDAAARGVISHVDPIEKKPFYHFQPGSRCCSVGVQGCNMNCPYCINWELSQPHASGNSLSPLAYLSPQDIVSQALAHDCASIAFTYTEPAVFFEYVLETAQRAKADGLANVIKTNGFALPHVWDALTPVLDAANVDLKSMSDRTYRQLGGQLEPVLNSLRQLRASNVWLEVTTLIVAGQNDNEQELAAMAQFIAEELGPDTPWHLLRSFPHYKMSRHIPTPMETLNKSREIGRDAGLKFVYLSNLLVTGGKDTHCPNCGQTVITRTGTHNVKIDLQGNRCQNCGQSIYGGQNRKLLIDDPLERTGLTLS